MLSLQTISGIRELMSRCQLSGKEVPAFTLIMNDLDREEVAQRAAMAAAPPGASTEQTAT